MIKTLVIRYMIEYTPENEHDILRYCQELVEDAALVPDFDHAELDGKILPYSKQSGSSSSPTTP